MADLSTITLPSGEIYNLKDNNAIPSSEKGTASGVAELDANGLIPQSQMPGMVILSYGNSTWDDFLAAYQKNNVVYCRASSNSNPASGSQTRLAFMAYVNNATSPTEVEFQYYRSVASHTITQQGDQVYVYKLNKSSGWSVTVREAYTRITTSTGITSSLSGGVLTEKAALVSETALTNVATAATEVADRVYPVAVDVNGKLAVNVPWESGSSLQWTIDNNGSGSTSLQATIQNDVTNNVASGLYSHAEGTETTATGQRAHAEGKGTSATANGTHAEGYYSTASGAAAHAEGANTIASGINGSHAEGNVTVASGQSAHAEGEGWAPNGVIDTSYGASGRSSHSEGMYTKAQGEASHAEGGNTVTSGSYSHAEGYYTISNHKSQHVFGEYNTADSSSSASTARGNYIEIVGNGTMTSVRSNARTLDWSGNEVLAGKLTVGAAPTNNMDVATKQYVDTHSGSGTVRYDESQTLTDTQKSQARSNIEASGMVESTITAKNSLTIPNRTSGQPLTSLNLVLGANQNFNGYGEMWSWGESKNLLTTIQDGTNNMGVTWTANPNGAVSMHGTALSSATFGFRSVTLLPGTYMFSGYSSEYLDYGRFILVNPSNQVIADDQGSGYQFTISTQMSVGVNFQPFSGASLEGVTLYPMICLASDPDPLVYVPYCNMSLFDGRTSANIEVHGGASTDYHNYSVALGQNVYGATLDVPSGNMTVTHGYVNLNGFSQSVMQQTQGGQYVWEASLGDMEDDTAVCSMLHQLSIADAMLATNPCFFVDSGSICVCAKDSTWAKFSARYKFLEFVYSLTNPTTSQVTPTQVTLFDGENQIFVEDCDITASIKQDVADYAVALEERVDVLETNTATKRYVDGKSVRISSVDYEALTPAEKVADTTYFVYDESKDAPQGGDYVQANLNDVTTEYFVNEDTTIKKLNHPLYVNGQYIYPPTSSSLVKRPDGKTADESFITVGQEASTTTPVKPTYPLQEGNTPIYPKTTVDQVISRDGITPLSEDGIFQDDVLTLEEIEASTDLNGYAASASAVKSMGESLEAEIDITKERSSQVYSADVLADSLAYGYPKFFIANGSNYTGVLPSTAGSWAYGAYLSIPRSSSRFVIGFGYDGYIAINTYNGTTWTGWKSVRAT